MTAPAGPKSTRIKGKGRQMQVFTADDGARLCYRDEGRGYPVLALAGLTRNGSDFDYLVPHLPDDIRLIRLDSRGRGASQWTGADTYTVLREAQDVLGLLDHLKLKQVAILGSSRGGLIGMLIALTARDRLSGLCLNDVGPVLERAGLERISTYVGRAPALVSLAEIAARLPAANPGFRHVSAERWMEEAERHFIARDGVISLPYDPDLKIAFDAAMAGPLPEAWPLYDACTGMPLALLRGEHSDLLSAETAREMKRRIPALDYVEVRDRAHIPFLDEPDALACLHRWFEALKDLPVTGD